jgi:Protein of unknown function, DUF547
MKYSFIAALSLLLSAPVHGVSFEHSGWNDLVTKNVVMAPDGTSSAIDYAQLKRDDAALKRYVTSLSKISRQEFDSWPKPDQLAFLINAYNAWTASLILTRYPDLTSIRDLGTLTQSPWQKSFIPLLGETVSLDNIEHDLIRGSGRYNDPRIHFGVNCASIGCPALINQAYEGAKLDQQLEMATKGFLKDRSRNKANNRSLAVSQIFDWYGDDFKKGWRGAKTLNAFFALYANDLGLSAADLEALNKGEMEISFLEYDWRLNDIKTPRAAAKPSGISPLWLLRSHPVLAVAAGGFLLILIGGFLVIMRRRRKRS